MSEMEVGNQQEVVNNYDNIIRNNTGVYDQALRDMSMGKAPSVNGGGGDGFSMLSEAIIAKSGPAGGVFSAASESGFFGGSSPADNSAFFGGGGGKPRTKADVHRERRWQMALTNSNPITGKLSRSENLALWKELRREMAGKAPRNKNPMMSGGTGRSFTGDKESSPRQKMFPTKGDLSNPHVLRRFGLQKIAERISDAQRARVNRTLFEDLKGSDMGLEDAKESLKTQQKDELRRVVETTMVDEKRDAILQGVMAADDFDKYKVENDKSAEGDKKRQEMEEKASPHQAAQPQQEAPTVPKTPASAALPNPYAPPAAGKAFKAMAPPKPSWARGPNRFGETDS